VHVVKLIEGWLAHHAWHNTSLVVDPRVPVVLLTCLGTTRHLDTMAQHDTKGPARLEYYRRDGWIVVGQWNVGI
jgi:hypothetical protein